jgi:hypothetical protein
MSKFERCLLKYILAQYFDILETAEGGTVVKVLCYKSEGRWFVCRWYYWNFSLTLSCRTHYGPGIDSASNRKEYQKRFLRVKAAGA